MRVLWRQMLARALLFFMLALSTAPVHAQRPPVEPPRAAARASLERARAALDRARFIEAVRAYDEAAAGEGLSRADVVELLRGRALARHASRDVAGAERDLVGLLSLVPDADLGDLAPPAMQRTFARLRGEVSAPLSLVAEATPIPDGFSLSARVVEDVASIVREVRVSWAREGVWEVSTERTTRVPAGERLLWTAEAIGPGGAVLARAGTRQAPEEATRTASIALGPEGSGHAQQGSGGDDDLAIGLGVTGGLIVLGTVLAVVLYFVLTPEPQTMLGAPMERP